MISLDIALCLLGGAAVVVVVLAIYEWIIRRLK